MTVISETIRVDVNDDVERIVSGLQSICRLYKSCKPKREPSWTIEETDWSSPKVRLQVPIMVDSDLTQVFTALEGDRIICHLDDSLDLPITSRVVEGGLDGK